MPVALVENAPAKINLTLRVLGRRQDGYHEIESLVAFADFGDRLTFTPSGELMVSVSGSTAGQAGDVADNLVLKAARALAALCPGSVLGAFRLDKRLPVAAGLGGGSADAGAALRLIARANGLSDDDPRLLSAARATGSDVPVCLNPRMRVMRGIGEQLSPPLELPPLPAVLVNPGVALTTKVVFDGWTGAATRASASSLAAVDKLTNREQFLSFLATQANDLEGVAIALAPVVADVLGALRALANCRVARMSGSGSSCFALFATEAQARAATDALRRKYPRWWVTASVLAG